MYIVEIQPSYTYLIYKAFLSKTTARERVYAKELS